MSLKIVVLAKQVPDTRNVGKDAMKEDGTINRAALPAIFNPEDLNALEQALQLKEQNPGSTITPRSRRRYRTHRPRFRRCRYAGNILCPFVRSA